VADAERSVFSGNLSADGRWITFHARHPARPSRQQILVASLGSGTPVPSAQWIPITSGEFEDDKPRWSLDGRAIYFTSLRDGFRCLYVQGVDADTKRPIGEPANVRHFHSARLSMLYPRMLRLGVSVARDRIVLTLVDRTANLWMVAPEEAADDRRALVPALPRLSHAPPLP
jgi:hypothetical protein